MRLELHPEALAEYEDAALDLLQGFIAGNRLHPPAADIVAAAARFHRPKFVNVTVLGGIEAFGEPVGQQRAGFAGQRQRCGSSARRHSGQPARGRARGATARVAQWQGRRDAASLTPGRSGAPIFSRFLEDD